MSFKIKAVPTAHISSPNQEMRTVSESVTTATTTGIANYPYQPFTELTRVEYYPLEELNQINDPPGTTE